METFYDIEPGLVKKSAVALGFFDGVHPGHKLVISEAVEEAKRSGLTACVVTFKDHPRELVDGFKPLLLTTIDQRLELFAQLGVQATLVLSFTKELCNLSPRQYVENVLVNCMGARFISVGHNHHFGRNREGTPKLLSDLGKEFGFTVHVSNMVYIEGVEVSSSQIRKFLLKGNIEQASKFLSRPYTIVGEIVPGDKRGRTLGFATANLEVYEFQVLPPSGVYAGFARLVNDQSAPIKTVVNIGYRPTFKKGEANNPNCVVSQLSNTESSGTHTRPLIEAHLLDFNKDIYGQKLEIAFSKFLRNEQKFDNIEQLKKQIASDCNSAKEYLQLETTEKCFNSK